MDVCQQDESAFVFTGAHSDSSQRSPSGINLPENDEGAARLNIYDLFIHANA